MSTAYSLHIPEPLPVHNMLGLRLHHVGPERYLDEIIRRAHSGLSGYCCVTNVHQCVLVHDDPAFAARVNEATFVLSDSVILQSARSLRHGVPMAETLRGADIMMELCRRAAEQGVSIALVGGKDDAVLDQLKRRLAAQFPSLDIAFAMSPPFAPISAEDNATMVIAIRSSRVQLVFVGLGCPKQEIWMAENTGQIDAMMIGVGAAFDFNAGVIKPSPPWIHRAGLEWLYRLVREPRRLWRRYLFTSPRFVWLLVLDALKGQRDQA